MFDRNKPVNRAIFFDRDGTLIYDPGYLSEIAQIKFFDGVLDKISQLKEKGFKIFIVTNQSGVGRGYFTENKLKEIHIALMEMMSIANARADGIIYCPHVPEDQCLCRKPNPNMVVKLAKEHDVSLKDSFFVGDKIQDVLTGKNSGCRTALVMNNNSIDDMKKSAGNWIEPDFTAATTVEVLDWILDNF